MVDVHVGGVTVWPGDLLHGDCNGVTTIPAEIAADVVDACEEFVRAEEAVLSYARSDHVTTEGLAHRRGPRRRLIEKLRQQVTSTR